MPVLSNLTHVLVRRANVGDDISFSFDLAGVPAQSSSSPAVTAQPGRQSQSLVADLSPLEPADRTPQGPSPSPNASVSDAGPPGNSSRAENQFIRPLSSSVARSSAEPVQSEATGAQASRPDELEAHALPSNVPTSARPRIPTTITEEITESPAHKPGSGHRRRIAADNLAEPIPRRATISSSSTPEAASSSSPSTRRPRPSDRPTQPARPTGLSRPPTLPVREERAPPIQTRAPANRINPPQRRSPSLEQVTEEEEEPEVSGEEAVKVPAREAATKIGQKRPRPSNTTITSTELGTDEDDDDDDDSELNSTSQISSYPRKRQSPSQRQPAKRSRQHSQQSRSSKSKRHSSSSEQNDDRAAEITVQRFVNNFQRDDDDDLQQEIPYANRAGETVVDVFAQLCDEVMSSAVDQLKQRAAQTDDVDTKKQCRIKIRAIDAYREELGSRLLQHAIHLNHWHSLRRRLRHVQKEKLALRDEIIRLKGERAQVALRMDAIRIKHESDSTESM
ncbi:hypothetical protein E4U54_006392, partial [Claviceps lovelessii]